MKIQERKIISYQTYWKRALVIKLQELEQEHHYSDLVFLCIGSDRVLGDCLGPLIGEKLKDIQQAKVYGTLANPLCYGDVENCMKQMKENYENPCIIAIDAALSTKSKIGNVLVSSQPLQLGESLHKQNVIHPSISIKIVVGENYFNVEKNLQNLQTISLKQILDITNQVGTSLIEIFS